MTPPEVLCSPGSRPLSSAEGVLCPGLSPAVPALFEDSFLELLFSPVSATQSAGHYGRPDGLGCSRGHVAFGVHPVVVAKLLMRACGAAFPADVRFVAFQTRSTLWVTPAAPLLLLRLVGGVGFLLFPYSAG